MAIRVRKLAKELRRDAEELLGILHALGFTRFRSTQDMLSDQIVLQLRKAVRDGVTPLAMSRASSGKNTSVNPVKPPAEQAYSEADLTMELSDWLKKEDSSQSGTPKQFSQTPDPSPTQNEQAPGPSQKEREQSNKIDKLESEVQRLLHQLEMANARLAETEASLKAVETQDVSSGNALSLVELLEARGLVGDREFQAALSALLGLPIEHAWIRELVVKEPEGLATLLHDRLVFVGGESSSLTRSGRAPVVVTSDRVERASDAEWLQSVEQISETLLLFGLRRVMFVGGDSAVLGFLRQHLDRRIQFSSVSGTIRSAVEAESDVHRNDLVVLWDVEVSEGARKLYDASKSEVIWVEDAGLPDLSDALRGALG